MRTILLLLMMAGPPTEIRILYDNTSVEAGLQPDWGFAALVTRGDKRVLFDTGAKPDLFIENLRKLEIDPSSIEHLVISHNHGDHTGGIKPLWARNPRIKVHMPEARTGPFEVTPGIYSTGPVQGQPIEQALVIETAKGIVVLTGCSHPGVVKMVEAAEKQSGRDSVRLVLGGFHMLQQNPDQINATISSLKQLNVASAIPTHCSGDLTIKLFREAFRTGPNPAGAGKRIVLD